ncbi:MAG: LamG-like jellyroll fold domain-containing protein [Planctomycetota bacterium]|jgi:hypothetical protein
MLRKLTCFAISILVLGVIPQSVGYGADPSLVGWWTFDDGAGTTPLDSSDYGRHGEFVGSPQWSTGQIGGALQTSAGNYVVIPGYTGILGPSPRTTTAWIKTTDADGVIIGWGLLSPGTKWIMRVNQVGGGGQLRCEVDSGYHYGTTSVNDDEWHHVAVVLEDDGSPNITEVKLFVDGVRDADNADMADEPIDTIEDMNVTIGQNPHNLNSRAYDGLLDEIRVYDRALTEAEIQAVMNEAGQGFPTARAPEPEDGSLYVNTWANLKWRPGDFAVSNDIYFSTNFDDVNDGAEAAFAGNTAMSSQVVGFPGFPAPGGLEPGVTYYWRVDGINETDPNSPWRGEVWSFFVPPKTAYNPDPADGMKFIDTDVTLNWTGGFDAKLHTVYFGDNRDNVAAAAGALPQTDATFAPGALELDKTYYWRIDEFDGALTHTGNVWSFTTVPDIPVNEDPNLTAWWTFDENMGTTALDWSGHGNHATLVGPQWSVPGRHGDAGLIMGSATYLTIDNLTYDSADIPEVTVCAWISTRSPAAQYIASFDRDNYWRLEVNGTGAGDGQIGWDVMTSSGQVDLSSLTRIDDGRWHHVCGVFDNGRMTIYIDGRAEPSVTGGTTFGSGNPRPGIIGGNSEAGGYNGGNPVDYLDDLRIYDRALTAEEIVLVMRGDPLLAWNPTPADGSTPDIDNAVPLTWSPGDDASRHDVYFGTDRDAVNGADSSDTTGIYRGSQSGASFTPAEGVEWGGGPYYWRIDENNADGTATRGRVWTFAVVDFVLVDDFESYTDDDAAGKAIWQHWIDGYGVPTNGSQVGYEMPPYAEQTIVNGGVQSMPLAYDNTAGVTISEAVLELTAPRDWTKHGVSALSLSFRGHPASVGGFAEGAGGTFTMTAAGADIAGTVDQFHFAYKVLTGPGTIVAKMDSIVETDPWAKAGVMIRETLDADSKHAFACVTPGNGVAFQGRTDTGTSSFSANQTAVTAPHWIRLERDAAGNFIASHSTNGSAWEPVGSAVPTNIPMTSNVYVGLALTSHNSTEATEATFSNIAITGSVSTQWEHQDIGILSNDSEPLYVALSNKTGTPAVVVHDDANASATDVWTEWIIDLSRFADQGVNLADIDKIAIGLGTAGSATATGGSGTLFIDDVRLLRPAP